MRGPGWWQGVRYKQRGREVKGVQQKAQAQQSWAQALRVRSLVREGMACKMGWQPLLLVQGLLVQEPRRL